MNLRSLTWKLNWYRQSELDGALLLGRLVRTVDDTALVLPLTRHCADEARHAYLWAETGAALGLPVVRIFRSYQSFYGQNGGAPGSVAEALALTHAFEKRVWRKFQSELSTPGLPAPVATCLRTLLEDEKRHLDWVREWLGGQPRSDELVERFTRMDEDVYASLLPFEDRLWDVPGLGQEMGPRAELRNDSSLG
jgi:hypothetical protein